MSPHGEGVEKRNKAPKKWEEPQLKVLGGGVQEQEWKEDFRIFRNAQRNATAIHAYPLDMWDQIPEVTKEAQALALRDIYPEDALLEDRFDLLYGVHTLKLKKEEIHHSVRSFFIDASRVRKKLDTLIGAGRMRGATYLLRTVERFYPKLNITPKDYLHLLPHYPALPITYEDEVHILVHPEAAPPAPLQDLIVFCVHESSLIAVQRLKHEIEKVVTSSSISDEAKDSGALRQLRTSISFLEQSIESEIHTIAERLGKQFLLAVNYRLTRRHPAYEQRTFPITAPLRDREDAFTMVKNVCERLSYAEGGVWSEVAEGIQLFFTKFLDPSSTRGEVRAIADHLLDLVHNGGSMFGWIGSHNGSGENEELNKFPLVFLEFRKHIVSENPGQAMIDFMREFHKFIKSEGAGTTFDHYWYSRDMGLPQDRSSAQIPRRFPLLFRLLETIKEQQGPYGYMRSVIRGSHWDGRNSTAISKTVSANFITELETVDKGRASRITEMSATLERLKQTYGYKETM